jgi:hypothetical protein
MRLVHRMAFILTLVPAVFVVGCGSERVAPALSKAEADKARQGEASFHKAYREAQKPGVHKKKMAPAN